MKKPTTHPEFSFSFVWSAIVARSNFIQIPKLLILHQADLKITPSELNVLITILFYKWTSAHPFVSAKTLATQIGLSEHAIRTNIRRLEDKGMLIRVPRGYKKSNAYDLTPLIKKLESCPQIPTKSNPHTIQIQIPTYSKMNSNEYANMDTELYAVNETPGSRRTGPSGKLEHINGLMPNTHRGP